MSAFRIKMEIPMRSRYLQFCYAVVIVAVILFFPVRGMAKVYIDITSFDVRMPVAISNFTSDPGLAAIIRSDLEFTHAFQVINPEAYIESPGSPFSPDNWLPLNSEAVLKGSVSFDKTGQKFLVEASLYDPVENRALFQRQYQSDVTLLRSLAHQVSSDVYEALTSHDSVFRTRIAYVVKSGNGKEIYLMDWDGKRARRMTRTHTLTMVPKWSQTGRYLAYSSLRQGRWGMYLLDLSKADERLLYGGSNLSLPGSFDPDGQTLYFSASQKEGTKLFKIGLDGKNLRKITNDIGIDVSPTVSPDGRRVAFVSDRGGSPQIYVMNARGGPARRITFKGNYNTSPTWSPMGDRIAFVGRKDGALHIFTITPDGEALTQLTNKRSNDSPAWSPDGRYIAFSSGWKGESSIYIMLANGDKKRRISPPGQNATSPSWSPLLRF